MPIYEYECRSCGHQLEAIQKMSDAALKTCPACAQDALKKRISAAGFRLSGSGWYETDFKTGSKKNLTEKTGDSSASTSGSASKADASPTQSAASS